MQIAKVRIALMAFMALVIAAALAMIIVAVVQHTAGQKQIEQSDRPDFKTLAADEISDGLIVCGTVDSVIGKFAASNRTEIGGDEGGGTAVYYTVPVYHVTGDGDALFDYVLVFEADIRHAKTMEKIYEQSWKDVDQYIELRVGSGVIKSLPGDLAAMYDEWTHKPDFDDGGSFIDWSVRNNMFGTDDAAEIEAKLLPYMLAETQTAGAGLTAIWIYAPVIVIALAVLLIVWRMHKRSAQDDDERRSTFQRLKKMDNSDGT